MLSSLVDTVRGVYQNHIPQDTIALPESVVTLLSVTASAQKRERQSRDQ